MDFIKKMNFPLKSLKIDVRPTLRHNFQGMMLLMQLISLIEIRFIRKTFCIEGREFAGHPALLESMAVMV